MRPSPSDYDVGSAMISDCLRWIDRLSAGAAAIGAVCLVAMTVLMLGEVVARSVFSKSLTFSWEFSSYLMGAAFFLSAGYGLRTGGHVRVTLLSEAVPPTVSRALDFFSTVVGIVVTLYIAYAICDMTYNSYKRDIVSFTPTETPLIIPQGVLALGAVLFFLQMVARFVRLVRDEPPDVQPGSTDIGTD